MIKKRIQKTLTLAVLSLSLTSTIFAELEQKQMDYLKLFGWTTGMQTSLNRLGLNEEELKYFISGLSLAANNQKSPLQDEASYNQMNDFLMTKANEFQKREEKNNEELAKKNMNEATKFYEELSKKPGVKKTATGLYYEITEKGASEKPTEKSTVTVHYTGTLTNGTAFDSSKTRGKPASFALDHVIPGFREGLQLIGKGGKIKLYMPPQLGYGNQSLPGIPAGSTLIFEVDMIDFKG